MLPYIQSQMPLEITECLLDLIRTARMIEDTEYRVLKFCPSLTNSKNLVEPDLANSSRQSHVTIAPVNAQSAVILQKT